MKNARNVRCHLLYKETTGRGGDAISPVPRIVAGKYVKVADRCASRNTLVPRFVGGGTKPFAINGNRPEYEKYREFIVVKFGSR